jgi:hypothetical protein
MDESTLEAQWVFHSEDGWEYLIRRDDNEVVAKRKEGKIIDSEE